MLDPMREVLDPGTSAERLSELAARHPELGTLIAAHPNCYVELQQWIARYAATEPTTASAPTAALMPASARQGRFWTRTKVIISGTIAFIGAVTGVISVIPILTRDATNFSHLEIAAEPLTPGVSEWAIPAEALDLGFPLGDRACGDEQVAWLAEHAEALQRGYMLNLRNAAREGAMLALTDFRSTTAGDENRGPIKVRLVCDPSGVMPEQFYYGKLMADDPERSAVHVRVQLGAAPGSSPEIPVAFNLAPGESGRIPIELFSRNPVAGAMRVTVLSRDEQRVFEIEGSEFEMPSLLFGGEMFLFTTAEGLQCSRIEAGTLLPCTLDELRHELSTAR